MTTEQQTKNTKHIHAFTTLEQKQNSRSSKIYETNSKKQQQPSKAEQKKQVKTWARDDKQCDHMN